MQEKLERGNKDNMRMIKREFKSFQALPLLHLGRLSSGAYLQREWLISPNGLIASCTNIPILIQAHVISLQNVNGMEWLEAMWKCLNGETKTCPLLREHSTPEKHPEKGENEMMSSAMTTCGQQGLQWWWRPSLLFTKRSESWKPRMWLLTFADILCVQSSTESATEPYFIHHVKVIP